MNEALRSSTGRQESAREVVKNSAVISAFNALGFASALMIDIAIAARFGLGQETDAFFIAFTIPRLSASILLVAFNVVLVPIFTRVIVKEGKPSLWCVSSNLANLALLGGGVLGITGSLSASLLIRILGAGLDDATQHLAISLCAIVFLMAIPLGAIEVFKATLNALRNFAAPAATALVRNGVTFLVVVLYGQRLGIHSLAFGYVVAAWLELLLLGGMLLFKGFQYNFILHWREPWTTEALSQIRPPLAGAILGQSNVLLERFLASFLPVGLVSALGYARRILRAVDSIFLGSISTALLPRLSTQSTQDNMLDFKRSLSLGIKLATFVSTPLAIVIISLNVPIVQLLFQRGAFDQATTHTTARLLSLYILGIPPMALFQILVASYYASGDTKTPFYIRVVMLGLNAMLDVILFFVLGAGGLALALSLTRTTIVVLVIWLLYRRLGSLGSDLLSFVVKIGFASAIMGMLVFGLQGTILENLGCGDFLDTASRVVTSVAVGVGLYTFLVLIFQVREVGHMIQILKRRFKLGEADELPG